MTPPRMPLKQLEMPGNFIRRHIGSNQTQIAEILAELKLDKIEDLILKVIPDNILEKQPLQPLQFPWDHRAPLQPQGTIRCKHSARGRSPGCANVFARTSLRHSPPAVPSSCTDPWRHVMVTLW